MMRASNSRPGTVDDDSGVGLIELLVAMIVGGLVVAAAATILINSWLTQEAVVSTTNATNRGQVMGSTIERAMRNARDFQVAPDDDDGTELRVWTTLSGSLECQGFQLVPGGAKLATSAGSPLPAVSTWGPWDTGVVQHGSEPFFSRVGETVTYTFDLTTESVPVHFVGEAYMRSTPKGAVSPCW
jgi:prepilin-type N-terminal cleavage/methylation domain-containing protein